MTSTYTTKTALTPTGTWFDSNPVGGSETLSTDFFEISGETSGEYSCLQLQQSKLNDGHWSRGFGVVHKNRQPAPPYHLVSSRKILLFQLQALTNINSSWVPWGTFVAHRYEHVLG